MLKAVLEAAHLRRALRQRLEGKLPSDHPLLLRTRQQQQQQQQGATDWMAAAAGQEARPSGCHQGSAHNGKTARRGQFGAGPSGSAVSVAHSSSDQGGSSSGSSSHGTGASHPHPGQEDLIPGAALWAAAGTLLGPKEWDACVGEARKAAAAALPRFLKDLADREWKTKNFLLSTSEKVRYVLL